MMSTCTGCKRVFSGMTAFDKHRVGGYGDPIYAKGRLMGYTKHTRHCMSESEMVTAGLELKEGRWGFPASEESHAYFEKLRLAKEQRVEEAEA